MNRQAIDAVERTPVEEKDLKDALRQVLLSESADRPRSENREPTREEVEVRFRLERRKC